MSMLRASLVLALTFIASASPTVESVAGVWAYKKVKEKAQPGMFAPQFIHLTLAKEGDGWRGSFSARFRVPASVSSPDVNFELKSVDETARHFSWKSADGNEGTLTIEAVQGNALRIEWRRTSRDLTHKALAKGEATLVRQ